MVTIKTGILLAALCLPLPTDAADIVYDPVPMYEDTARELVETVLARYQVGTTYSATRRGELRMNGAPLCDYLRVWEQTVLAVDGDVYTVEDRQSDNVNPDCELREVRRQIDAYSADGWLAFLGRVRAQYGERAISVYIDKDEDVFGWSLNREAIRYDEVGSWLEFMDRLLLMTRRGGTARLDGAVFDFSVETAEYLVR